MDNANTAEQTIAMSRNTIFPDEYFDSANFDWQSVLRIDNELAVKLKMSEDHPGCTILNIDQRIIVLEEGVHYFPGDLSIPPGTRYIVSKFRITFTPAPPQST